MVASLSTVKNLDVYLDQSLKMDKHIQDYPVELLPMV